MNRKLFQKVLIGICILSISMNIFSYIRKDTLKEKHLIATQMCLKNISILLSDYKENIKNTNPTSNGEHLLADEFWKLDQILDDFSILFGTSIEEQFGFISYELFQQRKSYRTEEFLHLVTSYQEIIDEAYRKLSIEEMIEVSEGEKRVLTPNNSLCAHEIAHILNDSLLRMRKISINHLAE